MPARLLTLAVVAACSDPLPPATPSTVAEVAAFPAAPSRELDVLFLIDDSSFAQIEGDLHAAMATFTDALAAGGDLPDLRVAVATSDLGTTGSLAPDAPGPDVGQPGAGGCTGHGKDGVLQRGISALTDPFLTDAPDGAGGRTRNYTGALPDVIGQMIKVGAGGCGFEQDLRAIDRALARNPDFARPTAGLAVVVVGDEDDCSVRDAAVLSPGLAEPLTSFHRCTQHGVACAQPLDAEGAKTGCVSREDSPYLEPVGPLAAALRARKPPAHLAVGAIVGPREPFALELRPPPGGGVPILALAQACTWQGTSGPLVADPAVRIADFVAQFGPLGALTSVCTTDLRPQLTELARTTKQLLGIACLDTARLVDTLDAPGLQPACEVHDVRDGLAEVLPRCPADGDCYDLVADAAACPETSEHLRVAVTRTAPSAGHVEVFCEQR